MVPKQINYVIDIMEKVDAEISRSVFVKDCRWSSLLQQEEEICSQSSQPRASTIHDLVAGPRFQLTSAVGIVTALGFLDP
jgi:hypothetical protein